MTTKIYHRGTEMDFGKCSGELIRDLIEDDPKYISWLLEFSGKIFKGRRIREFVLDNHAYNLYTEICGEAGLTPESNNDYKTEIYITQAGLTDKLDDALVHQRILNRNLTEYKPITLIKGVMNMKNVITVAYDSNYQIPSDDEYVADGKQYSFLTTIDDLKNGEFVVVNSAGQLQVARVVQTKGLSQNQINRASAWIVNRVDMSAHVATLKKQELVQEVRNKIKQRRDEMEEMVLLKTLAVGDENIRGLLTELAELDPDAVPAGLLTEKDTSTESS